MQTKIGRNTPKQKGSLKDGAKKAATVNHPELSQSEVPVNEQSGAQPKAWDRLFILAHERTKAKEEYLEQYRKEKEDKEVKQYSFKPVINENSLKLAAGAKTTRAESKKATKSTNELKERKQKEERRVREMKECTFTPNASSISKNPAKIFNSLYEDAKNRKIEREKTANNMYIN